MPHIFLYLFFLDEWHIFVLKFYVAKPYRAQVPLLFFWTWEKKLEKLHDTYLQGKLVWSAQILFHTTISMNVIFFPFWEVWMLIENKDLIISNCLLHSLQDLIMLNCLLHSSLKDLIMSNCLLHNLKDLIMLNCLLHGLQNLIMSNYLLNNL